MVITVEELKGEIKAYSFETLTGGNDEVATKAILKAEVWVRAVVRKCDVSPDFTDEIVRDALICRALYKLYSYAENEGIASDKRQEAVDLLRAKYGNCVDGGEKDKKQPGNLPVVDVTLGSDNWNGYK